MANTCRWSGIVEMRLMEIIDRLRDGSRLAVVPSMLWGGRMRNGVGTHRMGRLVVGRHSIVARIVDVDRRPILGGRDLGLEGSSLVDGSRVLVVAHAVLVGWWNSIS